MVTVVNWNKYYYCNMVLWYHVTRVILVPIYHSIFHRITIDYFYWGSAPPWSWRSTIAVFLQYSSKILMKNLWYSLCHNCDPQPQFCGNRHRDLFTDSTNTDGDMKVHAKLRMILKLNSSTVNIIFTISLNHNAIFDLINNCISRFSG